MKLLYVTNVPSPYRVDFFNELGKTCELTVLFERGSAQDRNAAWSDYSFETFEGIVLRGIPWRADSAFCPSVATHLARNQYDAVIVTNFTTPTGILALACLRASRRTYFLESDGGFARRTGIGFWVKRLIMPGAEGYLSTSASHDQYYVSAGADARRLHRYPFSSIHDSEVLPMPPSPREKQSAKKSIGVGPGPVVLAIGQFIPRKGFDVLLRARESIATDATLCIVGGEPTPEYLRIVRELKLTRVQFVPFVSRDQLRPYFTAADVFVLPTREDIWGLVVNEAIANAVPVVTTNRCLAGSVLIDEGKEGYIVPVDEPAILAEAITRVLDQSRLSDSMAYNCLSRARSYTIESMTASHVSLLSSFTEDEL